MAQDADFTNGQYVVLYDPQNTAILLAINEILYRTPKVAENYRTKELRQVGALKLNVGNTTIPSFELQYSALDRDKIIEPLEVLARAFERKGEYGVEPAPERFRCIRAKVEGSVGHIKPKLDFEFNGGLRQLEKNLIIAGKINAIVYSGSVIRPMGRDLDMSEFSDPMRNDSELNFAIQLFGFIGAVYEDALFKQFSTRRTSGWYCSGPFANVYYHRISSSHTKEYSIQNSVGTFNCALGILQGAKGIHLMGIQEVLDRLV